MKTMHSFFATALLAAGALAIASQSAVAGYGWDAGCGCRRAVEYVQPYVPQPAVVNVLRPRVVYQPHVVYEAVPAVVVQAPPVYAHGCGACVPRGLFTGYYGYRHGFGYGYGHGYGYGYAHRTHYGPYGAGYGGYGYGADYGYGPTD